MTRIGSPDDVVDLSSPAALGPAAPMVFHRNPPYFYIQKFLLYYEFKIKIYKFCLFLYLQQLYLEDSESDIMVKFVPPQKYASSESGNGFTLLSVSDAPQFDAPSHRLRVTAELFDILSGQSDVDHPLCEVS